MISIVVITYNREKSLRGCIKSLLNQSCKNYEIIIIDDGSTKQTQELIKTLQKKHKIIRYFRQENKGRGAARNLGIKKARGCIIAFTDDDCTVPRNWLENLKTHFKKYPNVTAVGGAVVNGDKNPFGEATHILNFSSWLPTGKIRYIRDIPTANIAYRRKNIKGLKFPIKYKGLDYEDSLFNYSLIKKGGKILFDPSISVCHSPKVDNYNSFLKNQQRKALSFLLQGYRLHGFAGKMLIRFKLLNLFCPRLLLVFLRCLKSPVYLLTFIIYFPIIFRGELERGRIALKQKFAVTRTSSIFEGYKSYRHKFH